MTGQSAEPIIIMRDVHKWFGEFHVLKGINLRLAEGERLLLCGGNGAGKTTIFQIILGLLRPQSGRVILFGRECSKENEFQKEWPRIGLLFQDPDDQLFSPSVIEDVAFGLLNRGVKPAEAKEMAMAMLRELGIEGLWDRPPYHLSGGEKRLAALASILVMGPDVLLLDEPTAGIEPVTARHIVEILGRVHSKAMIIISHQEEIVSPLATGKLTLSNGKLR